jgi:hypothetical protein
MRRAMPLGEVRATREEIAQHVSRSSSPAAGTVVGRRP